MGHQGLQQLIVHLRPSTLWYAQQRALARAIDISIVPEATATMCFTPGSSNFSMVELLIFYLRVI
jgi:hypothetical protein